MNESQIVTDIIANSSDHVHSMTKETQILMMLLGAKPLPDDCSCSPTSYKYLMGSAMGLHTMPQDASQASQTHDKGEHPGVPCCHACSLIHQMISDKQLNWTK